jgi:hypothetical protein
LVRAPGWYGSVFAIPGQAFEAGRASMSRSCGLHRLQGSCEQYRRLPFEN